MTTVNLRPTRNGFEQMIAMFEEQIVKSQAKIDAAQVQLDDESPAALLDRVKLPAPLDLEECLEALIAVEQERIEHMQAGIASAERQLAEGEGR